MSKKKYNIMFCWPSPIDPTKGGVERVTDMVTRELVRRGHQVYWLTDYDIRERYGTPVQNPPCTRVLEIPWKGQRREGAYEYARAVDLYDIDFVVDQTGPTCWTWITQGVYQKDGRPKFINVAHNDPIPYGVTDKRRELHWNGLINSVRFYDAVGFISEEYTKMAQPMQEHNEKCILTTLNNPCHLLGRRFLLPATHGKTLLYVGRFAPDKNPLRLIEVWKLLYEKHPDWNFVLVGSGKQDAKVRSAAEGLPRIEFKGWSEHPEDYYREASISLLTSDREGCPMAVLEAMAMGCVPVMFDSFGAVKDILPEDSQHLAVEPYSIQAMADKVSQLMLDRTLWSKTSVSCCAHVHNYKLSKVADEWENLFARLTGESS